MDGSFSKQGSIDYSGFPLEDCGNDVWGVMDSRTPAGHKYPIGHKHPINQQTGIKPFDCAQDKPFDCAQDKLKNCRNDVTCIMVIKY